MDLLRPAHFLHQALTKIRVTVCGFESQLDELPVVWRTNARHGVPSNTSVKANAGLDYLKMSNRDYLRNPQQRFLKESTAQILMCLVRVASDGDIMKRQL